MKSKLDSEMEELAARAVEFLSTRKGKAALARAKVRARQAAEPFRKARDVQPERLQRRYTV